MHIHIHIYMSIFSTSLWVPPTSRWRQRRPSRRGLVSPGVTILRGKEQDGYPFLEPWLWRVAHTVQWWRQKKWSIWKEIDSDSIWYDRDYGDCIMIMAIVVILYVWKEERKFSPKKHKLSCWQGCAAIFHRYSCFHEHHWRSSRIQLATAVG